MTFHAQHADEQAVAVAVQDGEQGEHAWQLVPCVRNPSPDAEFIISQVRLHHGPSLDQKGTNI